MSSLSEPAMSVRRLRSPSLGVGGSHPTPRLATAPRRPLGIGRIAFASATLMTPDSWHLPGRHEHGRPLLRRVGETALARSWS